MWTPKPASMCDIPPHLDEIRTMTFSGDTEIHVARLLGYRHHFAVSTNDEVGDLTWKLHEAIWNIDAEVTRLLLKDRRVADPRGSRLEVQLEGRVKTWPIIPGVTVPKESMPGDAS